MTSFIGGVCGCGSSVWFVRGVWCVVCLVVWCLVVWRVVSCACLVFVRGWCVWVFFFPEDFSVIISQSLI